MTNKTMLWGVVIVLVLVILGIFAYQKRMDTNNPQRGEININADTTTDISNDLKDLQIDDFNAEFEEMDKDINNL